MHETNEYDEQAQAFLGKTNTRIDTTFKSFGFHFGDDKHKRNIFTVTIANSRHTFSFDFGASLNDSLTNVNDVIYDDTIDFYFGLKYEGLKKQYMSYSDKITIHAAKEAHANNRIGHLVDKRKAKSIYEEFVKGNSNKYNTLNIISLKDWLEKVEIKMMHTIFDLAKKNFGEGIENPEKIHPRPYDILCCLQKHDPGTFENFCGDCGYDTDSRKAYETYEAVLKEWDNVKLLFTEEELNELQEIQ